MMKINGSEGKKWEMRMKKIERGEMLVSKEKENNKAVSGEEDYGDTKTGTRARTKRKRKEIEIQHLV